MGDTLLGSIDLTVLRSIPTRWSGLVRFVLSTMVSLRGPRLGRDSLVESVTVQKMGEKWSGYAAYRGEFLRTNTATHRVNVGLRLEF